jgi:hypothetical protein
VDAAGAQLLEERCRRVAAADEIVEQSDGHAARRRRHQRLRKPAPDAVVLEDIHLQRHAFPRRVDGR